MRLLLLPLTLVAVLGCATLPPVHPSARPVPYRLYTETLPSGMRLVVYERPGAPRVSLSVSYAAGSLQDPEGKEGLAHLLEHLTFRARPGRPGAPTVQERLELSGAEPNAYTQPDGTDYVSDLPQEALARVLDVEAARLANPLAQLSAQEFAVERDVVLAELAERTDDNRWRGAYDALTASFLPGHAYSRTPTGTPASVGGLTLEDAREFVRRYYTPEHAVVVVTGPLAHADVRHAVVTGFGALALGTGGAKKAPAPREVPVAPELLQGGPQVVRRQAPVESPRLYMLFLAPGRQQGMAQHAQLLAGFLRSDAREELADDRRVKSVDATARVYDGLSLVAVEAELVKAEDAEAVARELGDAAYASSQNWFARPARDLYHYLAELETLPAANVARHLLATGEADYLASWMGKKGKEAASTNQFGFERLGAYGERYFTRERARFLLLEPAAGQKALPASRPPGGGEEVVLDAPAGAPARPRVPDVRRVAHAPGLGAESFQLQNGLTVRVVRRPGLPLVQAQLLVRTSPGTEATWHAALPYQAFNTSSVREDDVVWKVQGTSWWDVEPGQVELGAAGGAGNLEHLVADLARWVTRPVRESHTLVFDTVHRHTTQRVEWWGNEPDARASRALWGHLFPGHPYAWSSETEAVRALQWGQAADWLTRELRPERSTLLLVGEVGTEAEVREVAEKWLAGWARGQQGSGAPPQTPVPTARSVQVVHKPHMRQADLSVGLRWEALAPGDLAAADTLRVALQRRLERLLRTELGLTYGVHVQLSQRSLGTALLVQASVDRSGVATALQQVLAELEQLGRRPLPAEELSWARWEVARGFDARFATVGTTASTLTREWALQLPATVWEDYPAALAAVDAAQVQALAGRLSLGAESVVVLGDEQEARAQLAAAGLLAPLPVVKDTP